MTNEHIELPALSDDAIDDLAVEHLGNPGIEPTNFARAVIAAQQRVLAEQAVPVAQIPFLSDTDVAHIYRRVYGGSRWSQTEREFAAEIESAVRAAIAAHEQARVVGEPVANKPPGIDALCCVISSLRDTAHFSDEEGELTNQLRELRDWAYNLASPPAPQEAQAGMVLVPDWKGYALLGTGRYIINHSADFDPALGAELFITLATEEDRAGDRKIGETRDSRNPGQPVESEDMVLRIGFLNERGLFALEDQLRIIRETHFDAPVAQPATEQAEAPKPPPGSWAELQMHIVDSRANQPKASNSEEQLKAQADLTEQHRELFFATYLLLDSVCEDHPAIGDVFNIDAHGRVCNALAKLDVYYGVDSPESVQRLATQPTASNAGERERADPAEPMDDSDRLKPCPFCGSEAEGCTMPAEQDDVGAGAMFVQCTNSRCMASSALIYPLMDDPKPLLLERWNRRAALASKPVAPPAREVLTAAQADRYKFMKNIPQRIAFERWASDQGDPVKLNPDGTYDGSIFAQRDWYVWLSATTPAPAGQDEPDMFWNHDDPETFGNDIDEIIQDYGPGEIVKIDQAKRLPTITVRVLPAKDDNSYFEYEIIDAARGDEVNQK